MRSDDLVPNLKKSSDQGLGVRQGVVVSWNQSTGSGVVNVAGSLMQDLPTFNSTEASLLSVGDVVTILTSGSSWGILGRLIVPGSPEAVSALSALRTQTQSVSGTDSFTSTSFAAASSAPGPEVTIDVGSSGRLQVSLTAEISGQSSKGAASTMIAGGAMGFVLSGANTLAAASQRALLVSGNMTVTSSAGTYGATGASTRVVLLEGLNPGSTTVTAQYAMLGNGTQVNINNRNLSVLAL